MRGGKRGGHRGRPAERVETRERASECHRTPMLPLRNGFIRHPYALFCSASVEWHTRKARPHVTDLCEFRESKSLVTRVGSDQHRRPKVAKRASTPSQHPSTPYHVRLTHPCAVRKCVGIRSLRGHTPGGDRGQDQGRTRGHPGPAQVWKDGQAEELLAVHQRSRSS
jgi:hypothetical protein